MKKKKLITIFIGFLFFNKSGVTESQVLNQWLPSGGSQNHFGGPQKNLKIICKL